MKNQITSIITVLLFSLVCKANGQTFQKTYGSTSGDIGSKIVPTLDNSYAIVGFYGTTSGAYLLKIDSAGNSIWQKTFSPPNQLYFHYDYSLHQTQDSGFILAGSIYYTMGNAIDICLIKTNSTGDTLWTKKYAGPHPGYYKAIAYDVVVCSDGGFAVVGSEESSTNKNVFLIKTDSNGNLQWSKNYGGTSDDEGYAIKQTSDSGFVIGGYTYSFGQGGWDVYLLKVNSSGTLQWTKTYGGNRYEVVNDIEISNDGGFILTGYTSGYGTGAIYDDDLYLMKTDSLGNSVWAYTYGGNADDRGNAVRQTSDGGYIATGYTTSSGAGQQDVYLLKTDSTGNILWSTNYGGSSNEQGNDVIQHGANYLVVGTTRNFSKGWEDVYLIKTDGLGNDSCRQDTATTFKTLLPWIQGTGGTEGNGNTVKSDVIVVATPDTSSYNICVCVPPVANFYSGFTDACGSFYSSSTWADTWYWDFGDGDTSTAENPNHCFNNGVYQVCLTVTNACGTDSACDSVSAWMGINELQNNQAKLSVVPNPFENFATIKFDNKKNEILQLEVVTPIGQIEKRISNIKGNEIQIERNNLTSGLYFVLLKRNEQVIGTGKIIVR